MRMKRLGATLVTAVLAVGLAACGGGGGGSSSEGSGKVTISYSTWGKANDRDKWMQPQIDAFEKENPNIKVDLQLTPPDQYWTKLKTAASSGTAADVYWMNGPNLPYYAANGVLAPLDDLVSAGQIDTANYPKALTDLYTYDGKFYGVPKDFDTVALWYNKKLFDAAGVKYPDASWTWETTREAAKKLTDKSKGIYGYLSALDSQQGYYDAIAQAGGSVVSADGKKSGYDSPEAISAITYLTDFIKDGSSPSLAEQTDADPNGDGVLFQQGKVAMMPAASYNLINWQEAPALADIDVAPLPKDKKSATIIHGLANVVSAKSKHLDAAKKFAAFLGGKPAAEIQAKAGAVLPAFNGTQQDWISQDPSKNLKVFVDVLPTAVPYPSSKNTTAWSSQETDILSKAYDGSASPADACKQMAKAMNEALAQEG